MPPAGLNIIGLLANLFGVILLFLFGMPFRIRTGGNIVTWTSQNLDYRIRRIEGIYDAASWLGLVLIVLGTAMQVFATVRHA